MITISKILEDSELQILCKKFPDLTMDQHGDLISESSDPNTFQIYTAPTWSKTDVLIRFAVVDEETDRIIYVTNGGNFIGTKLDENSDRFKILPSVKDLEKQWLKRYDESFIRNVMNAIRMKSEDLSDMERQLLSINDQFQIYDDYLISNDDKVFMSDLEQIKEIVGADQIHIEGQRYDWKIKWFLPYKPEDSEQ